MKLEEKIKARELRSQGLSIKEIKTILNVSSASVSSWVKDIKLTKEQIDNLKQRNPVINGQMLGAKIRKEQSRKKRLEYQIKGKEKAKQGNLLHQAGCMLYWAEGAKHKNTCSIVNTDANMLKFFLKFLREQFNLKNDDFVIRINYYTNNGLTKENIEEYWLSTLDLQRSAIRKGQENNRPKSAINKTRFNVHPYGMCCIAVKRSTHIIQHIYGAIQEYAGFDNNYMLG